VQLHLLAPSNPPATDLPESAVPVASETLSGVPTDDRLGAIASRSLSVTKLSVRSILAIAFACVTLLGQGERCRVDTRFVTPSATLNTFWGALRDGDANSVWECFVEGRHDLPRPGMLWFLPPTEELSLGQFRSLPVTSGRVMVTYEVRFRPAGTAELHTFRTGDELVRMRGEWRITRPIGEASMPAWTATPGPVDI
jgi:hypothetical protein